MADSKSYTVEEVDQKLADIKNEMMDHIDKVVLMSNNSTIPSANETSMWFKITDTETK